jgi:hypothetical protein
MAADVDVGAEMTAVARALKKVRTNGAASIAAGLAQKHGRELARQAERLPDLFRGAAAGSLLARAINRDVDDVARRSSSFAAPSLAAAPPPGAAWDELRRAIERTYIDGTAVYAASDLDVSFFRALVGDLDQTLVKYGAKLADAGLSAPGVLLGDVARAIGGNVGQVALGAGEGVTHIAGSLLSGLKWPLLIIGGILVAAVVYTPKEYKVAGLKLATKGIL